MCEWLLPTQRAALLNVKLEFIEKSVQSAEASRDQYMHNLSMSARMRTSGAQQQQQGHQEGGAALLNTDSLMQRQASEHGTLEMNMDR